MQALKCFMYEFWDDLQHHPVVDDPQLQQDITWDTAVPPDCVHLLGNNNTRICYIRLDRVRPGGAGAGAGLVALLGWQLWRRGAARALVGARVVCQPYTRLL